MHQFCFDPDFWVYKNPSFSHKLFFPTFPLELFRIFRRCLPLIRRTFHYLGWSPRRLLLLRFFQFGIISTNVSLFWEVVTFYLFYQCTFLTTVCYPRVSASFLIILCVLFSLVCIVKFTQCDWLLFSFCIMHPTQLLSIWHR